MFLTRALAVSAIACAALTTGLSRQASAAWGESMPLLVPFHVDINASAGYSGLSGESVSESPTLLQWSGGITAAPIFYDTVFVGLTSDFRYIGQYSDVVEQDGNFRGTRWNIASPTLGIKYSGFLLKFDYQVLGDYDLSENTFEGATFSFTEPKGFRGQVLYNVWEQLHLGVQYETLKFERFRDSERGEGEVSPALSLWQAGAVMAWVF